MITYIEVNLIITGYIDNDNEKEIINRIHEALKEEFKNEWGTINTDFIKARDNKTNTIYRRI